MHSYLRTTVRVKPGFRQSLSYEFHTAGWTPAVGWRGVIDSGDLPIEDPREVQAFLRDLPIA